MTSELKLAVAYRRRAEEWPAEAVNARHPDTKRALTQVTYSYLKLAAMIEDRTENLAPKPSWIQSR